MKRPLLLLPLLLLPALADAHTTGVYYQAVVGEHSVDVGYSTAAPVLGEVVLFDFQLRDKDSENSNVSDVPFEDVWVKVTDERNAVVLATGVHNFDFGGPRLSYAFPHAGAYTISVRYETSRGSLAEAAFPLTVVPAPANVADYLPEVGAFLAGILAALLAFVALKKRRRSAEAA